MKILLKKASDWNFEKVIEINDIMELKNFGNKESEGQFVINFNFAERLTDEDIEKYKECSFEAMIYDNYIE